MEKVLFEIPVYISSEDNHYKRWSDTKNNYINYLISQGDSSVDASHSFYKIYEYAYYWDYNKTIGFIRIFYDNPSGDLKFKIYVQGKKVIYNKVNKMMFKWINGTDLHVYVRNLSNDEIIKEIKKKLNYIKKNYFKGKYLDLQAFNNICKYLDFQKIISECI